MEDENLGALRNQLDAELNEADNHVGIKFGIELYKAFAKSGWLTAEKFSISGTGAWEIDVIAYRRSHYASADWEISDWKYKIGRSLSGA